MPILNTSDFARFESKILVTDDCWLWTDAPTKAGYGLLGVGGRAGGKQYAHILMYQMARGEIPHGLDIDHLCRVRNCVNPYHLEAVTRRVNLLRGVGASAKNAVKTHCIRGHAFDEKNTRLYKGRRQCRTCFNAWKRENRRKKKCLY